MPTARARTKQTKRTKPLAPKGKIRLHMTDQTVDFRSLLAWVGVWPVVYEHIPAFARCEFLPMRVVKHTVKAYWQDETTGGRVTLHTAYRRIATKNWLGKWHQIMSLARVGHPAHRPTILVKIGSNVCLDGNHTMMALCSMGYTGEVLVIWVA